jgi:signal transduction histidine kinase
MTDATVRRLAYAVFAFCIACYGWAIVSEFLSPITDEAASWGSGNAGVDTAFALATLCFPLVGLLITHRHARNTIGWLMLAIGVTWAWSAFSDSYVYQGASADPGSLPHPDLVAALSSWTWIPAIGLMGTFLILLFPDGRLPSPRWRAVGWVSAASIIVGTVAILFRPGPVQDASVQGLPNPLGIEPLGGFLSVLAASLIVLPLCILACAAAVIVRVRRSRGLERLQLKWLASAAALVAMVYCISMAASLVAEGDQRVPAWVSGLQDAALVSFGVIPLAIGVAILKHRLYGIDVVINKAVVFGALASFITAVYIAIVVGIGSLVGQGDRPNLPLSITATAVVAVAFQPVRERVQRFANRLVFGSRATPYEVLSDFADRMGGTYAAADLLPLMAKTVANGVGASRVDVWLTIGADLVREATWPQSPTGRAAALSVRTIADLDGDRVVPVRHHGDLLGALSVIKPKGEFVTPAEDKLLDDVAAQAGLVLRNVRLIEDLRSSRQRLVTTSDAERRRLERNLHDGAQQNLVSVALLLRTVRSRLAPDDTVGAAIEHASDQLGVAIEELRELARGIHPAILTDRGLGPAIRSLVERSPVPVVLDFQLTSRPSAEVEGTCYFVVAEALTNVAKYAHASQVRIAVAQDDDNLTLSVDDDGIGGAVSDAGSGLRGLTDRVAVVDGNLHIDSPVDAGTHIVCTIPLPPDPQQPGDALPANATAATAGVSQ